MKSLGSTALAALMVFSTTFGFGFLSGMSFDLSHMMRGFSANKPEQTKLTPAPTPEGVPPASPLPIHFPDVSEPARNLEDVETTSLNEAMDACWPSLQRAEIPKNGILDRVQAELLFGKIKKREVLETKPDGEYIGLLFDDSVFKAGAAGRAVEKDGAFARLQLRASGHILHCDTPNSCQCL